MPQIRVTRTVVVRANDVATVRYPAGYCGPAPKAHVEAIVRAGAGLEPPALTGGRPDKVSRA